jgi:hypothetical protein
MSVLKGRRATINFSPGYPPTLGRSAAVEAWTVEHEHDASGGRESRLQPLERDDCEQAVHHQSARHHEDTDPDPEQPEPLREREQE